MFWKDTAIYAVSLLLLQNLNLCAAGGGLRPPHLNPVSYPGQSPAGEGARVRALLQKRERCAGGGRCILGDCCGEGCADNCCAHDEGGIGCGMLESCSFDGNVFIGCCPILPLGHCTGEATRITVHTPYSTVTLHTDGPTNAGPGRTTSTSSSKSTSSESPSWSLPTSKPTSSSSSSSRRESTSTTTSRGNSGGQTGFPGDNDNNNNNNNDDDNNNNDNGGNNFIPSEDGAVPIRGQINVGWLGALLVVALWAILS